MNRPNFQASTRNSHAFRRALPHLILLPSVALILSGLMTWANPGTGDDVLFRWARGFVISLVLLPMILAFVGALEKQVDQRLASAHWIARKLLVSVLTACVIETVLALAVSVINQPADRSLAQAWWMAFSRSLPAGMAIGLFMCFYMKPKMDRMALARADAVKRSPSTPIR